ncbi:MAG: hypothetical protein Q7R39_20435 [Dehalococcoidia bacterium]|nr:hypothetical protein [Dehalococcoidia bacterium]
MPLDRRDIEGALENKLGFHGTEGDHRRFSLYVGGRLVAETMTSHGTGHKTIGDNLVAKMARQLLVPRMLFVELVRCTKTRMDYLQVLASRGIIPEIGTEE